MEPQTDLEYVQQNPGLVSLIASIEPHLGGNEQKSNDLRAGIAILAGVFRSNKTTHNDPLSEIFRQTTAQLEQDCEFRFQAKLRECNARLQRLEDELKERELRIHEFQARESHVIHEFQARGSRVRELLTMLDERDAQVRSLEEELVERDELLSEHESKIAELEKAVAQRDEMIKFLLHAKRVKPSVRAHPYLSSNKLSKAITQLETLRINAEQSTGDLE